MALAILRQGIYNSAEVQAWQQRLQKLYPELNLSDDGDFGAETRSATIHAQREGIKLGLLKPGSDDGVRGPETERATQALEKAKAAKPIAQPAPAPTSTPPAPAATPADDLKIGVNDIVPEARFEAVAKRCCMDVTCLRAGLQDSCDKLNGMNPQMRAACAAGISDLFERGTPVKIADGMRTAAQQNAAFRAGLSGARAGQSYHNYGLAFDLVPMSRFGQCDYSNGPAYEAKVSAIRDVMGDHGLHMLPLRGEAGWHRGLIYDPAHFAALPEMQMPVSRMMHLVGGRRDDDGHLIIPNALLSPELQQATDALMKKRHPEPPKPALAVASASHSDAAHPGFLSQACHALGLNHLGLCR